MLLKVAQDATVRAIARATALLMLADRPSPAAEAEAGRAEGDTGPMVRIGALRALEDLPLEVRWKRGSAALSDPVRGVRVVAASLLADMPPDRLGAAEKAALERASRDYIEAASFIADRGEERANLASFYARQGKADLAEREYLSGIRLAPNLAPPRAGLADLYRAMGREDKAEAVLRDAITEIPGAAILHNALGLCLVRQQRYGEALESLKRAFAMEPDQARHAYVYAVALDQARRSDEARAVLSKALVSSPSNAGILSLLLEDALNIGRVSEALSYAKRLSVIRPSDPDLRNLVSRLKAASN